MGARCRRRGSRTIRQVGFTSRRPWNLFRIPRATTVRGHLMWNIKTEVRSQKSEVRKGFTLAEGLVASVVLAVAVGGIIAPISASYQQTQTVKQSSIAISMAQQLMDEILSKPFADPSDLSTTLGPEADEGSRTLFDNVDD